MDYEQIKQAAYVDELEKIALSKELLQKARYEALVLAKMHGMKHGWDVKFNKNEYPGSFDKSKKLYKQYHVFNKALNNK